MTINGRPNTPAVWANGSPNYAAGSDPWSGTTTVNEPAYNYFIPGIPPAAQEMNAVLQDETTAVANVIDWVGQLPALNWKYSSPLYSGSIDATLTACDYNFVNGEWDWGTEYTSSTHDHCDMVTNTSQGDLADFQIGSGSPIHSDGPFISCLIGGNGNTSGTRYYTAMAVYDGGSSQTEIFRWNPLTSTRDSTAVVPYFCLQEGFQFKSLYVFIGKGIIVGNNNPSIVTSPDCVTWTNRTPAGEPGSHDYYWTSAQNGSIAVILPRYQPRYVANPRKMCSSTNGTTWTFSNINSDGFQGVCWDNVNLRFVAVSTGLDGSGNPTGSSTIWTSPDGLAWTSGTVITSATFTSMAALGSLIVVNSLTGDLYCSYDGGVSWRRCGYKLSPVTDRVTPGITTLNYVRPMVVTNGGQFVAYCTSSRAYGFKIGKPPGIL